MSVSEEDLLNSFGSEPLVDPELDGADETSLQEPTQDDVELLSAIDAFRERGYGGEADGELQQQRARSIEFYLGNNVEPAPDGRSQVVDRSVFETVQWILPSLSRIFAGGDNVVEFEALGPDDEEASQQESDFLNYLVTQKNAWHKIITVWFQDALTTKNAYCMAFIDERVKTETERYERQSDMQITHLLEGEGVEVVGHTEYPDEEAEPQPMLMQDPQTGGVVPNPHTGEPLPMVDPQTNQIMMQPPPTMHDIEIRRNTPEKKLCFKVLPPERCIVAEITPDHTLLEAPYFEYWAPQTISDLRAQGFDVPDDLPGGEVEGETEEDDARDMFQETYIDMDGNTVDPAMRRVRVRTVWVKHDFNGDGISELQRCIIVGRHILDRREESRIPVAAIVPFLLTHRHPGLSLVDIVGDIQRIMTAILRQGLDNLYISQNPRPFVNEDKVNLDDVLLSRPGQPIRAQPGQNPVLGQDFGYMEVPNIFPNAINGLEYMDSVKEKRTGVSKSFTGASEDVLDAGASGRSINMLSTAASQRVEQIARLFSEGVEHLFSISHELLLKHGHKREAIKLRGQWVDIDPSTWKTGRDLRISVTYGAGNKDALASRLNNILNVQSQAIQQGFRIADEKDVYDAAMDLAKASDLPQKYFTDPSTAGKDEQGNPTPLPPPEPPPNPVEVGAQIEQMKEQGRTQTAEMQERGKAELAGLDAETEITLGQAKLDEEGRQADLRAQVEVYKADKNQETQVLLKQIEGGDKIELESVKAQLSALQKDADGKPNVTLSIDGKTDKDEILKKVESALDRMSADREVVRDPETGAVTGSRPAGG